MNSGTAYFISHRSSRPSCPYVFARTESGPFNTFGEALRNITQCGKITSITFAEDNCIASGTYVTPAGILHRFTVVKRDPNKRPIRIY